MKKKESRFVVLHVVRSLSPTDGLLINYNFRRPPTTCQKHLTNGLHLDVPLGRKKKNIDQLYFFFIFNGTNVNVFIHFYLYLLK